MNEKKTVKKLMKLPFWPWNIHFLHFLKCSRCRRKLYAGSTPFHDRNYIAAVQNGKSISQKFLLSSSEKARCIPLIMTTA